MDKRRIKIPVVDINEISDKMYMDDRSKDNSETLNDTINESSDNYNYYRRHRIHPRVNKISQIFDDSKYSIKDDLQELKNRGLKFQDKNFEKIVDISNFSKDLFDDIFFKTNDIYNRFKYIKNQDKGREIKVEKKE